MTCEQCENKKTEAWPRGKTALRCFSEKLNGRVIDVYPDYAAHVTAAPKICPKRSCE